HILQTAGEIVAAGGNLGPAARALPLLPDRGVYALEMSSYMLERIATLRFDAAAMLNLSADHLDRHFDMAGYASAKRAVFARQGPDDLAVIGVDDPDSRAMAKWRRGLPGRVLTISGSPHPTLSQRERAFFSLSLWERVGVRGLPPTLPGEHNAQNAAAAIVIARALDLADDAIAHGIATF